MNFVKRRVPRLFVEHELEGESLSLGEAEAHYLGNVLRLRVGERVVAFNGRGAERGAVVSRLTRRGAELGLEESLDPLPEPALALTLVQALIKSDAMDWIVQKATELGVRRIAPVYSDFSVVKLERGRAERRVEHWARIARSACEQSGRHRPPLVEAPAPLAERLAAVPAGEARFALVPGARLTPEGLPPSGTAVAVAVGPEGGWSERDLRDIEAAGFVGVAVGPRVLRADTAAITACALLQARWGDL
ncbi:MAG TPA: 16S rRNA (uracil(1498)-N(3))-methyltransferase [Gammaproteobacteria bacterium]